VARGEFEYNRTTGSKNCTQRYAAATPQEDVCTGGGPDRGLQETLGDKQRGRKQAANEKDNYLLRWNLR